MVKKSFLAALALALLFIVILPFSIRFAAGQALRSILGPQAIFSGIRLRPHSVLLTGIRAGAQKCDSLEVRFNPLSLLASPSRIGSVRIGGLALEASGNDRSWILPGIKLRRGSGHPPIISNFDVDRASVRITSWDAQADLEIHWAQKDKDTYRATAKLQVMKNGRPFEINGQLDLGTDLHRVRFDSVVVLDSIQKIILAGSLSGAPTDFLEAMGSVELGRAGCLMGKTGFPLSGKAQVWARLNEPAGACRGQFRIESPKIDLHGYSGAMEAWARYEHGAFQIDSLRIKHRLCEGELSGLLDIRRNSIRLESALRWREIATAKGRHLLLNTHLRYQGPLRGDYWSGKANIEVEARGAGSGPELARFDFDYEGGELFVSSRAAGGEGLGGGRLAKTLDLSGEISIDDIGDLAQLAGIDAKGRGRIRWRAAGLRKRPTIEIQLTADRCAVEAFQFDSAGLALRYANGTCLVESLYAASGPLSAKGRGEWAKGAGRLDLRIHSGSDSTGSLQVVSAESLCAEFSLISFPLRAIDSLFNPSPRTTGYINASMRYCGPAIGARSAGFNPKWHGWLDWGDAQYRGVKFDWLSASFAGIGNTVRLDSLRIQHDGRFSVISGRTKLPFSIQSPCSLSVALDRFPLDILPLFLQGSASYKGVCSGKFALQGKLSQPEFNGTLRIDTLTARPWSKIPDFALYGAELRAERRRWAFSTQGRVDKLNFTARADGNYSGADSLSGRLQATIENSRMEAFFEKIPGTGLQVRGKTEQVSVSMLHGILPFLRPINGLADVRFRWRDSRLTGELLAQEPQFHMIGSDSGRAIFSYKDRRLDFDSVSIFSQTGLIRGAGGITIRPSILYDFNAQAQGFPIEIKLGKGLFWGDVHFFGDSDSIHAFCSPLRVRNLDYYIPKCDQVLRIAEGEAEVTGNRMSLRDLKGMVEDRPGKVSGDIDFNLGHWQVHFWGEGDSLHISKGTAYWALVERGTFDVGVSPNRSRIKLALHLASGEFTGVVPKMALLQPGRGLYDPRQFEESQHMSLQIQVTSSESLWVNNNLARVRFGADLTVGGNASLPIWQGQIEFHEGEIFYLAQDVKPFILSSGNVSFTSHQGGFNPQIDLEASHTADIYWDPDSANSDTAEVFLGIHGPLKKINSVELDCPAMVARYPELARQTKMQREMTILSVLLTGRPWEQLVRSNLGAVATNQAGSMFQAYFQAAAQRRLAQLLHLDAVRITGGDWSKIGEGKGPDLVVTDKVGRKVTVEWASRVGSEILQSQQVKLQYQLRDNFVVESAADQQTNYGMDLKYILRF